MDRSTAVAKTQVALTAEQFQGLAAVPPEAEWFANLTNPNTRRAYKADVRAFMAFLGIQKPEQLRVVTRAHLLAWRKTIAHQAPATVRRKLVAVSSLFDYLCEQNAMQGNPAAGVARPKEGSNQGKTPAISDRQARRLLDAPNTDTVAGKRDRAILTVFLFYGPRRAEVAALRVRHLAERRGVPHFEFHWKGGKIRYVPAHPSEFVASSDPRPQNQVEEMVEQTATRRIRMAPQIEQLEAELTQPAKRNAEG